MYKALGLAPGSESALSLNDYQVAWCYLNIIEDQKELQQMIFEFLDWYKWYVNPRMAQKVEEMEYNSVAMEDDTFTQMLADGLRKEGKTEAEIQEALTKSGLMKEE